jgi:hypothetical protein
MYDCIKNLGNLADEFVNAQISELESQGDTPAQAVQKAEDLRGAFNGIVD